VSQKISKTNPLTHYKGERDGCSDCRKRGGIVARTDADMFQLSRHTHTTASKSLGECVCIRFACFIVLFGHSVRKVGKTSKVWEEL